MTKQNPRLVGELTAQEEAEIVALEASIRDIHQLATMNPEDARRATKAINSIRNEAARGLQTLLAVDVDGLDAYHRRDYLGAGRNVQPDPGRREQGPVLAACVRSVTEEGDSGYSPKSSSLPAVALPGVSPAAGVERS